VILFLLIAALVVGLDHLTKWIVVKELPFQHDVHILGEWVMLTHIKNTGAAFGLFPGSIVPLIVISVGASLVVIYLAVRQHREASRLVPLGLILGGAIGNLIDRILAGKVTDFINVGIPDGARWPVFNVADSAVSIGVAILAFGVYFRSHPESQAPPATLEADPARGPIPPPPPESRANAVPGEPV
jgi:signal peptidase II